MKIIYKTVKPVNVRSDTARRACAQRRAAKTELVGCLFYVVRLPYKLVLIDVD